MNYKTWAQDQVETLVSGGVPRASAERLMDYAAREAESEARVAAEDRQFLIDYRAIGSARMAERKGKSREWARSKFNDLIRQENSQEKLAPELRRA